MREPGRSAHRLRRVPQVPFKLPLRTEDGRRRERVMAFVRPLDLHLESDLADQHDAAAHDRLTESYRSPFGSIFAMATSSASSTSARRRVGTFVPLRSASASFSASR